MTLDALIASIPTYAKDLQLNYSVLVRDNNELTPQQLWGTVLASAMTTRNASLTGAVEAEAKTHMSDAAIDAAKSAAAIMGMTNIYHRFLHLSVNQKYTAMPTRLRMNALRSHGVAHIDFELWSLAASAINGCGKCVDAHETVLRDKGVVEDLILGVIRIASIIHAIGVVLEAG
jgi:alkyl hydroperoxide reductase subunit D